MKQQTAVDFIIKSIKDRNEDGFRLVGSFLNPILEQAKEIEKEQIMESWYDGRQSYQNDTAEGYYNETFNNK